MKNFLRSFTSALILSAVGFSNGWHLPAIQGFAWFQMFNTYTEKVSSAEALQIIFAGKDPCCICDFVQQCKTENENTWKHWQSQKTTLYIKTGDPASLLQHRPSDEADTSYVYYRTQVFEDRETPPPRRNWIS